MYGHLVLVITIILRSVETANVLVTIPFSSKSHYIALRPIGLELARRGHNVTIITAHREADPPPNYHEVMIDNKEIWDVIGEKRPNIFTMVDKSAEEFHKYILWRGGYGFTQVALNSTQVRDFLKKDNKFDLVISEHFFYESFYFLAHIYKAPLVLLTTAGNSMSHNFLTGNPLQLNTVVHEYLDIKSLKRIWCKMRNVYFTMYTYLWWKYWYLEKQEQLVKLYLAEHLSESSPSLYDLQRNASLLLINSHFTIDPPAALLPNIIEIGGIHLYESNSKSNLPNDLSNILDSSEHGVIYMNFGSNVRSSELPVQKKMAFVNVFRKLKQTILWKWEEDYFQNKSANIVTRKWLPQREILAHPNIKVFITHGGLIGTQEAIFNGVPIIGVPIYADQYNNILLVQEAGFGRLLEYHDINENEVENILLDVLRDVSYKNKANEVSQRFKDRPMTPLDTAMFWLEYVIRHKGADFMKNPARELNWFEYMMLDIVFVILLFIIAFVTVVIVFLKSLQKMVTYVQIQTKTSLKKYL